MSDTGVFVVSLDTELAWGRFDTIDVRAKRACFEATPAIVDDLLTLFDRYEIPATWALVAHLLDDCEGIHEEPSPSFEWVDWQSALPCRTDLPRELWYAPEILTSIREAAVDHDIGLHGYTHMILGAAGCTDRAAAGEIDKALTVAGDHDIDPESFIYPRNAIGHRDILADRGFKVYRGLNDRPYETRELPQLLRRASRFGEEATRRTPPTVVPTLEKGLVQIPGSQVFRPYHGGWQFTPRHSQKYRAVAGLDCAARTGEIFHLWFHPFNFARDPRRLLDEFGAVLSHAASLREAGELEVHTMSSIATEYRGGRWRDAT